jgi:uncharacterized protein (TIGR02186 family)
LTSVAKLAVVFALLALCAPARSESLVTDVVPSRIAVSSSYSGGTVVVFGVVQTRTLPSRRPYDVTVIVSGPRQTVVARRKGRIAGVWVNQSSRTFHNVPSFLDVSATRKLDAIAGADVLRRQGIGLKNALFAAGIQPDGEDPYLINLVNIRLQQGFFNERSGNVTFLSRTVFRTDIPLPSNVPVGDYDIDLKLFVDGNMVGETRASFTVVKVGVEDFVVKAAAKYSLIYGLSVMSMALVAGWLASIAFRRD